MGTQFFQVTSAGVVANVAIRNNSSALKPYREVEKLTFEVAGDQIRAKGGGIGVSKTQDLMPAKREIPEGAITHPDFPDVFVWFPK